MFKDQNYWERKIEEGVKIATMFVAGVAVMMLLAMLA